MAVCFRIKGTTFTKSPSLECPEKNPTSCNRWKTGGSQLQMHVRHCITVFESELKDKGYVSCLVWWGRQILVKLLAVEGWKWNFWCGKLSIQALLEMQSQVVAAAASNIGQFTPGFSKKTNGTRISFSSCIQGCWTLKSVNLHLELPNAPSNSLLQVCFGGLGATSLGRSRFSGVLEWASGRQKYVEILVI